MPIGGMNVSTVTTPSSTPSTTSACAQPVDAAGPNHEKTVSTMAASHPRTVTSNQSCIGPASVVVAWNTRYMTVRNMTMPNTGCSSTRSIRSDRVTRSRICRSRPRMIRAAQSKRASA